MARESLDIVIADGFDESELNDDGTVNVRCSQCIAMVINGVACHEHGCPNRPRTDYPGDEE